MEHGVKPSAEAGVQPAFSDIDPAIVSSLQLVNCLNLDLARKHQLFAAHMTAVLPLLTCCCRR